MDRPKVSYFPKLTETTVCSELDACEVIERIKKPGRSIEGIIRALRNETDIKAAKRIKESLPGVTWSGTFTNRSGEGLREYSGLLCADLDDVENPTAIIARLKEFPFIFAAFISPGGKGVKAVFRVGNNPTDHARTFKSIDIFLRKEIGYAVDPHTKDIPRLCFLSHDPNAFLNPDAIPFPVEPETVVADVTQNHRSTGIPETQVVTPHSPPCSTTPLTELQWVEACLPTAIHRTNRLLFNLARACLTQERTRGSKFSPLEERAIFNRWHASSDRRFLSETFEDYLEEFLVARSYAKTGLDESPIHAAWEAAMNAEPPAETQGLPDDTRRLASLCRELSNFRNPFFLSSHQAARLLAVKPMRIYRSMKSLQQVGLLELVTKGDYNRKEASVYRYRTNP